jgi:putative ubiquitin-RnfH superfamily antitoxin RatB of RatAB toxin-antitoxin module
MAPAERVSVTLARSERADQVELRELSLPAGSTLADALRTAGWPTEGWSVGIWGRVQPLDRLLRDGDRIELCRALTVDPKEARRLRYKRQRKA